MRKLICDCPFHKGSPVVVAYRSDYPSHAKPMRGTHGLICEACASRFMYGTIAPYLIPLKFVLTVQNLCDWMNNKIRIRWADSPMPRLVRTFYSCRVILEMKEMRIAA